MFKLVLWLFGLLCPLLLLDHRESIFGFFSFDILTMRLSTLVFVDLVLCLWLFLVIRCIYSRWNSIISNCLLSLLRLVNSTDINGFLIGSIIVECFLVIIVQHMHWKWLIWQTVSVVVSAILRHLIYMNHFCLWLSSLLSVQTLCWTFGRSDLNVLLLSKFILKL
jgi:hypothetical protein